jgi:hypothetical protein
MFGKFFYPHVVTHNIMHDDKVVANTSRRRHLAVVVSLVHNTISREEVIIFNSPLCSRSLERLKQKTM